MGTSGQLVLGGVRKEADHKEPRQSAASLRGSTSIPASGSFPP